MFFFCIFGSLVHGSFRHSVSFFFVFCVLHHKTIFVLLFFFTHQFNSIQNKKKDFFSEWHLTNATTHSATKKSIWYGMHSSILCQFWSVLFLGIGNLFRCFMNAQRKSAILPIFFFLLSFLSKIYIKNQRILLTHGIGWL